MFNQQIILAVDDNGNFLQYIPKEIGHKGQGRRHLAIAVLLENKQGRVLLQKRKHQIFDNLWDITGATHPLHKSCPRHSEGARHHAPPRSGKSPWGEVVSTLGVKRPWESSLFVEDCRALRARNDKICECIDESLEEATWRCLVDEFGIQDQMQLKNLGFFNYFAQYGDFCENEHCALMVGGYDGEVDLNPESGYEYKWIDKQEFLRDIEQNPQNYTPWAIESAKILK